MILRDPIILADAMPALPSRAALRVSSPGMRDALYRSGAMAQHP